MFEFYSLFIFSILLSSVNNVYLYKKYQLTAGTSLQSSCLYLIINGIVSALIPGILMLIRGTAFQFTPYSILIASVIVICAAIDTMARLKAYASGNIATVNVLGTIGNIILSCAWGVLMLGEKISIIGIIAICMMLASTIIISAQSKGGSSKRLLWLYAVIVLAGSAVSILNKQHQVETNFATIDTLSFSVWIGIIRTVIFIPIAIISAPKNGLSIKKIPKSTVGYATASSVISGSCYIITLFTSTVLPIVVTSPLSTGLSIIMCSLLPWVIYREKISKKQLIGITFSFIGAMLFLIG